jgi:hypothetical protein
VALQFAQAILGGDVELEPTPVPEKAETNDEGPTEGTASSPYFDFI